MHNFGRGMWRRIADFEQIQSQQINAFMEQQRLMALYLKNYYDANKDDVPEKEVMTEYIMIDGEEVKEVKEQVVVDDEVKEQVVVDDEVKEQVVVDEVKEQVVVDNEVKEQAVVDDEVKEQVVVDNEVKEQVVVDEVPTIVPKKTKKKGKNNKK